MPRRLRVALLGDYPRQLDRILGGVAGVVVCLSKALGRLDGVELHVLACKPKMRATKTIPGSGFTVHFVPRTRLGRLTFNVRDVRRLQRELHRLQPDVVHAQSTNLYAGAALGSPYPAVLTVHGLGSFAEEWPETMEIELEGTRVRILRLKRIIQSKEAAKREKDLLVLPVLKDVLKTRRADRREK